MDEYEKAIIAAARQQPQDGFPQRLVKRMLPGHGVDAVAAADREYAKTVVEARERGEGDRFDTMAEAIHTSQRGARAIVGQAELDRRDTTLRVELGGINLSGYAAAPVQAETDRPDTIDATLEQRGTTHGDYGKTAETAQGLKALMGRAPTDTMRESIDLICTKLARIANGDPFEPDHWRDIAGYAKLVADRLEREG